MYKKGLITLKTIEKLYENHKPLYPLERFCDPSEALFIDIETTGLKKETNSIYLIGCGHYTAGGFCVTLFFADNAGEECEILKCFMDHMKDYTYLLHFNGTKFDIPFLEYKARSYGFTDIFKDHFQLDIYRLCGPLRYLLFPDSMKQKSIEAFLGIDRDDKYNGGELIEVYSEYVKYGRSEDLKLLITHNMEDVLGMHLILPILYYLDLKGAPVIYNQFKVNCYNTYEGLPAKEVIFSFNTRIHLPKSFTAKTETMYLKYCESNDEITIRLPIYTGEMKVFFENYRDYCFLPGEDKAILKTLAQSLPKDRYKRATRETCYQKVAGDFVKQPSSLFTPALRESYKDKKRYFRFPDSFNKEAAEEFGRELINVFFTKKHR